MSDYNGKCRLCGHDAYIGLNDVACSHASCENYVAPRLAKAKGTIEIDGTTYSLQELLDLWSDSYSLDRPIYDAPDQAWEEPDDEPTPVMGTILGLPEVGLPLASIPNSLLTWSRVTPVPNAPGSWSVQLPMNRRGISLEDYPSLAMIFASKYWNKNDE